jgi:hypothetical protein
MPELIPCQRHLFDLPDDVAYLNCAYMSPLLKRAAEVGAEAMRRKLWPWRIRAEDFFTESERARALFAELLRRPTPSPWCRRRAMASRSPAPTRARASWFWPSSFPPTSTPGGRRRQREARRS